jgi:hypothetical protein
MDLRCPHRKFGEVIVAASNEAVVEVACPSRWCGKREGVMVLHRFSARTGELLTTRQFRTPKGRK